MNSIANPYLNRTAIKNDSDFIGRSRELASTFNRIDAGQPQSVSVVGERRIGKSSFMRALMCRRAKHLRRPDEFIFVYLDLQEQMHGDVSDFFGALLYELAVARRDSAIAGLPPSYESVRKMVSAVERSRLRLALLLDEFEAITGNRNFQIEFFSFLRSLPNNYSLCFIVTSAQELQTLCHSREIAGSPFFNIFHRLNLGPFTPEDARELIVNPSRNAGSPLEPYVSHIHSLAGYFPFFLQMACSAFFEMLHESPQDKTPDTAMAARRFREEAREHFAYAWEHLSNQQRSVCLKLVNRENLVDSEVNYLTQLCRRGYVHEHPSGFRLFSEAFETFLLARCVPSAHPMRQPRQNPGALFQNGSSISNYRIVEKIGEGGMGVVYKARDTHLDRFVAIKVLPPAKMADPDRKRRFVQEAKTASALNHPHIVTIYDIDQSDGVDFIAMEYVPGQTLDVLLSHGRLPMSELLDYSLQIADALATAHAADIVHRDLKPANVMVTSSGLVKILDFGLAKLISPELIGEEASTRTLKPVSQPGVIVGTPTYMSPEQAEGRKVDARSDIFSFGTILYEMATGQAPFRHDSIVSTLGAILYKDPKPPREFSKDISADMENIIMRCLSKHPDRRFQCLDELKISIENLRQRLTRPKSLPLALVAGIVVTAVIVAISLWYSLRP